MPEGYACYLYNISQIILERKYRGWGRKKTGRFASWCCRNFNGQVTLYEDGFIRSVGLGIDGSPSFSLVRDHMGIYYDAIRPSDLEEILNTYDFASDRQLMHTAKDAMELIKKHHISKYNNAREIDENIFKGKEKIKILVVAQTAEDASLEYGLGNLYTTKQMIDDAINENPDMSVYVKMHPDVLAGKKKSDIAIDEIPDECIVIDDDINPVSLLQYFDKVYTKTSGMGMEALILGINVVCYGIPYYAGWGLTTDKQNCSRRIRELTINELFAGAYILYTQYYNPYIHKKTDIIDTIQTIKKYKNLLGGNDGALYFFGFSRWKRKDTKFFFAPLSENKIYFCNALDDAVKKGLHSKSKIYIWGKKSFDRLESYAKRHNIPIHRVEDGFVRSVPLGSDLTTAYSLVVDRRGIYFDPTAESDLEYLLNTYHFDDALLKRSKDIQQYLIENKISKYNLYQDKHLSLKHLKDGQKIILVPGQVEDDASIIYGAHGMSNIELLQKTRKNTPEAYIIYKPHPDVLAGNRKGHIKSNSALEYCDTIITKASLDSVLELCHEVHTMTSLVGMEALIRGKKVYTYGLPFYAGWGLTEDAKKCTRRIAKRSLDELVAATFILYPRYLQPGTNTLCEIEVLLEKLDKEKNRYNKNIFYKSYTNIRNGIFRKIQLLIKVIYGE